MRARQVAVFVLTLLLVGDVFARGKPVPPSADMLEFLGTYETADGGGVDPVEMAGAAEGETMSAKACAKEAKAVKGKIKEKGRRL